jgi:hypothetical protein
VVLDRSLARTNTWMPCNDGIKTRYQVGSVECVVETGLRWQRPKKKAGETARFVHPVDGSTWQVESSAFDGVSPIRVSLQLSGVDDEAGAHLRRL